jgi:hypothetical protein
MIGVVMMMIILMSMMMMTMLATTIDGDDHDDEGRNNSCDPNDIVYSIYGQLLNYNDELIVVSLHYHNT